MGIWKDLLKESEKKSLAEAQAKADKKAREAANRAAGIPMCPKCGSTSLSANKKGFGAGKAAAGFLLAGPVGLAVGGIGSGKITITCLNCGHQFKPGK